jgi:DNA-binding response OmpR family regulator
MAEMNFQILVVDDEDKMRRSLADILRLEGYRVDTAGTGEEACERLDSTIYDLVLLDLKMPGMDGLEVLRFIRKNGIDAQVILLTAHGSMESAIGALREGAHDYLLKPCPPKDILTSVGAGLKRRAESVQREALLDQLEKSVQALRGPTATTGAYAEAQAAPARSEPEADTRLRITEGIWLDVMRREIHYGVERVRLTPAEGRLMQILLENPGRVYTHKELVEAVQGYDIEAWEAPEVLRPLVSRLRQKLEPLPGGKDWISSVRSTGYVFEEK